jgi:hypothetical protein
MQRIWIASSQKLDPNEWHSPSLLQRIQRQAMLHLKSIVIASKKWFQDNTSPFGEPHIRVKIGRNNQSIWQVWDPHNQETLYLSSEDQVRTWLEARYYTNPK